MSQPPLVGACLHIPSRSTILFSSHRHPPTPPPNLKSCVKPWKLCMRLYREDGKSWVEGKWAEVPFLWCLGRYIGFAVCRGKHLCLPSLVYFWKRVCWCGHDCLVRHHYMLFNSNAVSSLTAKNNTIVTFCPSIFLLLECEVRKEEDVYECLRDCASLFLVCTQKLLFRPTQLFTSYLVPLNRWPSCCVFLPTCSWPSITSPPLCKNMPFL